MEQLAGEENKNTERPPKPTSGYNIFIKELRDKGFAKEEGKLFLQEASKAWQALSQEERDGYNQRSN